MRMMINRLLARFGLQLTPITELSGNELAETRARNKELLRKIARLQAASYYYRTHYRELKGLPKSRKRRNSEEVLSR